MSTLESYGIEVTLVDPTSIDEIKVAQQKNTRMVFVETIANPVTQIAALEEIGDFCEQQKLVYVVDNTLTSSYLFDAKAVKVSLIVTSLSKYVSGHGNALGGSVSDTGLFDWTNYPNIFHAYRKGNEKMWGLNQIKKKGLRDMGGCLSSQMAHIISMGSETMELRMERQCDNALALAKLLDFLFVNYPIFIWAFFFGLILASIFFVGKTISKWSFSVIIIFLVGTAS
jgi:O-acetylhomoserine (thiol)-lyase